MIIQYISDIHLELLSEKNIIYIKSLIRPKAPILILAGDISDPFNNNYVLFLFEMSKIYKKIFIIAGNHEYYKNEIENTKNKLKLICDKLENVSFLDNSFEDYQGYRFIGSTLWSNIKNHEYKINDVEYIKDFNVDKYNQLHSISVDFLNNTLLECKNNNINSIIITHHLPTDKLTHKKYKNELCNKYNQWFCSDLDELIIENKNIIKAWFYGHTHSGSVQQYYNVNFYCNPLGYCYENDLNNINQVCEIIT